MFTAAQQIAAREAAAYGASPRQVAQIIGIDRTAPNMSAKALTAEIARQRAALDDLAAEMQTGDEAPALGWETFAAQERARKRQEINAARRAANGLEP